MITEYSVVKKHPLITAVTEDLCNYSRFSLIKDEPISIVKVGSWVYANPEERIKKDSDLDLIVVTANPNQKKKDIKITQFKNYANPVDLSILSIEDIANRFLNLDIDSVERVSSMSMPCDIVIDNGFYKDLNEIYLDNLIPNFIEFSKENLAEVETKKSYIQVPFEELILFPLMLDVYRTTNLSKSIDRFFNSDMYSHYITEYSDRLKDICLFNQITFDKDSFYLHLSPTKEEIFDPKDYLRKGISKPKIILLKNYENSFLKSDLISNVINNNKAYYNQLQKRGLLKIPHFEKDGELYHFKTRIDEFII